MRVTLLTCDGPGCKKEERLQYSLQRAKGWHHNVDVVGDDENCQACSMTDVLGRGRDFCSSECLVAFMRHWVENKDWSVTAGVSDE